MKRAKVNYTIQSVSNAFDILESFTKTEDELGVTELSKRLGLHKNSVFRLLATLEHRGYIEQNDATESYRLGPKILQIGSIFIEQRECRRRARPVLESIAAASGETAVVAVLRSRQVIYMDTVETDKTVRAVSRIGAMLPAHCTAVGKAQLAMLSIEEVERLYGEMNLPVMTEKSIRTRDLLLRELKAITEKGFALENEECELEVRSVAVPVRDFSMNGVAALAIVAPATRLTDARLEKALIPLLLDAGKTLSARLGYNANSKRKIQ